MKPEATTTEFATATEAAEASETGDDGDLGEASEQFETGLVIAKDQRAWLRAGDAILATLAAERDVDERVQWSIDRLWVATCDRMSRIMASDVTPAA